MAKTLISKLYPASLPGGLTQVIEHLPRVQKLGADFIWLSQIHPMAELDGRFNSLDMIDPKLGVLADFDMFVSEAHRLGLKVIISLPLNYPAVEKEWFREKKLNLDLVKPLRRVINFWQKNHGVDGFSLEFMVNQKLPDSKIAEIINAAFPMRLNMPFLIMECADPTFGESVSYYAAKTPVNFVSNSLLRRLAQEDLAKFEEKFTESAWNSHFMLMLEDLNDPRFPLITKAKPEEIIWRIFTSKFQTICLFQGQELGLMAHSDYLPLEEYARQIINPDSYFNLTRVWINYWKQQNGPLM